MLVQPGLRICLDNMLPSSRDPRPSSARRHYEWSRCASAGKGGRSGGGGARNVGMSDGVRKQAEKAD